ncbi:hypothetical protein [Streptomyces antarcticus]|uniref:hypothetical protein n=1 Tax=Streptomyces antarcticus TaxID=2996458 RepID=UPI00226E3887|nr:MULTISPECIES: hypothetical protein [unclassified Streptomyces]MCY0947056.1 hypothetical protein [Streptomyces sp. H34-AA3]MCZ4084763.1 hypothetical protein [Streptomyces sp. H34-S5]
MLTHAIDQGVLVISFHGEIGISDRAAVALETERLVRTCSPHCVVVELAESAVSPAGVSLVLRAHRLCGQWGMPLAVVTSAPEAQQLVAANAGSAGPLVFATVAQAVRGLSRGQELAS